MLMRSGRYPIFVVVGVMILVAGLMMVSVSPMSSRKFTICVFGILGIFLVGVTVLCRVTAASVFLSRLFFMRVVQAGLNALLSAFC